MRLKVKGAREDARKCFVKRNTSTSGRFLVAGNDVTIIFRAAGNLVRSSISGFSGGVVVLGSLVTGAC